nr:immunoglobulin heavy chain junction region [Macaca mulatta]MOW48055.1 immunoglobulin heavy chain junction region [Macaca mulatta]
CARAATVSATKSGVPIFEFW